MTPEQIWEELERVAAPGASGRFKRRIKPEARCDLFLAVAKPSNLRMMLVLVNERSLDGVLELPIARGLETRIARPGDDGADAALELVLTDPQSLDIFTALVKDVAESMTAAQDEASAVIALIDRLQRWQRFLQESGSGGLPGERQRGLYGELWLLRTCLVGAVGPIVSLHAWTGPEHASHDFQFGPIALEVKTTASKQHQVLRIVSERQLDDTGVDNLYLFHLSVDTHLDTGESLPAIVADLRESLRSSAAATVFEERLFEAGYLDAHQRLYENPGYTVRESSFYHVKEGFPRLTERDLVPGIGDVHYSVAVSECVHYLVDQESVMADLRGGHVND